MERQQVSSGMRVMIESDIPKVSEMVASVFTSREPLTTHLQIRQQVFMDAFLVPWLRDNVPKCLSLVAVKGGGVGAVLNEELDLSGVHQVAPPDMALLWLPPLPLCFSPPPPPLLPPSLHPGSLPICPSAPTINNTQPRVGVRGSPDNLASLATAHWAGLAARRSTLSIPLLFPALRAVPLPLFLFIFGLLGSQPGTFADVFSLLPGPPSCGGRRLLTLPYIPLSPPVPLLVGTASLPLPRDGTDIHAPRCHGGALVGEAHQPRREHPCGRRTHLSYLYRSGGR